MGTLSRRPVAGEIGRVVQSSSVIKPGLIQRNAHETFQKAQCISLTPFVVELHSGVLGNFRQLLTIRNTETSLFQLPFSLPIRRQISCLHSGQVDMRDGLDMPRQ